MPLYRSRHGKPAQKRPVTFHAFHSNDGFHEVFQNILGFGADEGFQLGTQITFGGFQFAEFLV